jgi:hypothetical protein
MGLARATVCTQRDEVHVGLVDVVEQFSGRPSTPDVRLDVDAPFGGGGRPVAPARGVGDAVSRR